MTKRRNMHRREATARAKAQRRAGQAVGHRDPVMGKVAKHIGRNGHWKWLSR